MKWENKISDKLRNKFGNKVFHTHDAITLPELNTTYSKGTIYRALHDLVKTGKIERLGRGIYRANVHEGTPKDRMTLSGRLTVKLPSGSAMEAEKLLRKKGIDFMITGAPLFNKYVHNLPRRLIELVYVTKGAGEYTAVSLREVGMKALINPTTDEVSMALDNFSEREIFVIREFSELSGNLGGVASLERALVDLYFETTRKKIPFPEEEVGRILLNVLRNEPISYSRLLTFADRRGIKKEIRAILDAVNPSVPSTEKTNGRHINDFLDIIRKEEWR